MSTSMLPYTSRLQPFAAWWSLMYVVLLYISLSPLTVHFAFSWTIIIILFADWSVFLKGNWDVASFCTNYIPVPVFFMYVYPHLCIHRSQSHLVQLVLWLQVCQGYEVRPT